MSYSLLALDTDHIKRYVFGTNKLKEIRGASSLLDSLNRVHTVRAAVSAPFHARTIFAHGGSALFLLDSAQAEPLGQAIQKLYREKTGGAASITYAIQAVPDFGEQDIMTAPLLDGKVTMQQMLKLLRARLNLAKDALQQPQTRRDTTWDEPVAAALALPSYVLLSPCQSCGLAYAAGTWLDREEPDEPEGLYCRACLAKRTEDRRVKNRLFEAKDPLETLKEKDTELWDRIIQALAAPADHAAQPYRLPSTCLRRPKDFPSFSEFTRGKAYLGLVYADANGMGQALETMETLEQLKDFAESVDEAIFQAMGDAIRRHLPAQGEKLPFDILLVGGDDIVMVTSATLALQVAHTLAERFQHHTSGQHTLSTSVVLAPVTYPFSLQRQLAEDTLKEAKKAGVARVTEPASSVAKPPAAAAIREPEPSRVNFVVVMGNTSLSYTKIYEQMHQHTLPHEEFYATLRPYSLPQFTTLLNHLRTGKQLQLGRTKLHQLREAILKIHRGPSATILEALMILRNFKPAERDFVEKLVSEHDVRATPQQKLKGTLFPWALDGHGNQPDTLIYRTPLLDFIELYDFVSDSIS